MKELIFSITKEDFEIQTFCSGGPGGQHQNKTASGIRIIHKESGATGESRSERSQSTNKKLAFERLTASTKFRIWLNRKYWEVTSGETIEQKVDKSMNAKNLKIETRENGTWS